MLNKHSSSPLWMILVGLLLLSSSCVSSSTPPELAPESPPTSTKTTPSTLPQAITATPTNSPTYTPTSTQGILPEAITIISTTLQGSEKWNLQHPFADPSAPELITETSDGYRLDPGFQVARIDLSYRWFGIGDRVNIYRRVELRDAGFWRSDTEISANAVETLVQSVARLRPQPQGLIATTHTDDYPSWAIELTDVKNNHVLLYSFSNAPNFTPWNVIYNGKIYTQFDGQIALSLPDLFDVAQGQPLATFWWRDWEQGYLTVATDLLPNQLSNGFSGLLVVYRDFQYTLDSHTGELRGRLSSLTEGTVDLMIGSLSDLQKIELDIGEGQSVVCSLEFEARADPDVITWDFVCPLDKPGESLAYRYPILLTFVDGANQVDTLSGELFGYWEQGTVIPAAPYPQDIGVILEASPVVRDLLTDHQIAVIKFVAAADPETGLLNHRWEADVVLIGQVQIGPRILPYSVMTRVAVEDSQLVHWDLDRSELQALLRDSLDQAITRRFLEGDPNLVLNLYYLEDSDYPIVRESDIMPCADLPVAKGLPSPGQPLRSFAFNRSWEFYQIQILLMDDGLRIHSLNIYPSLPEYELWTSLLPPELQPQGASSFRLIVVRLSAPAVGVYWEENASLSDINLYKEMFAGWNVGMEKREDGLILDQAMLDITDDGRLSLIHCQLP